jgi:hypothetical protein
MEDDLIFFENGRQPRFFVKIEDDFDFFLNGRQPHFFGKWSVSNEGPPQKNKSI